jgi:hypothetical protein
MRRAQPASLAIQPVCHPVFPPEPFSVHIRLTPGSTIRRIEK